MTETKAIWSEWPDKVDDPERAVRKEAHLAGRWEISGRRLRFEAGLDICVATVRILEEFVADCDSEFFVCVHEDDRAKAIDLITRWQSRDDDPEPGWYTAWLKDVADMLPHLWD